jgi:hypothetical protein
VRRVLCANFKQRAKIIKSESELVLIFQCHDLARAVPGLPVLHWKEFVVSIRTITLQFCCPCVAKSVSKTVVDFIFIKSHVFTAVFF